MRLRATRTVNPLHFEDLEPHRFEDLVRQLAYGFRPWSALEATGRLGKDEGVDIRGIEVVGRGRSGDADGEEEDAEIEDDGPEEREWRIQCKRYRAIRPKLMREIVAEAVPDPSQAPYALVVAAACDVSAQTMAAFRDELHTRNVREGHLWTKAHLEDLLFLPENDSLLFAYFGISLSLRRRSRLQEVRREIAVRRKILRAFGLKTYGELVIKDVLVRDVADTRYARENEVQAFAALRCPPWHFGQVLGFEGRNLAVSRRGFEGRLRPDGTWDILPETASSWVQMAEAYAEVYPESTLARERTRENWERTQTRLDGVPERERVYVHEVWLLPFGAIVEIDPTGDPLCEGVHLYCEFDGEFGPYRPQAFYRALRRGSWESDVYLDETHRRPLFDTGPLPLADGAPGR